MLRLLKTICLMSLITFFVGCGGNSMLVQMSPAERDKKCDTDVQQMTVCRNGLQGIVNYMEEHPTLYPAEKVDVKKVPTSEERDEIRNTWKSYLDMMLTLESIREFHEEYDHLDSKTARQRSFLIRCATFMTQYRYALELIRIIERDKRLGILLDEKIPELGLEKGCYSGLKRRSLHINTATGYYAKKLLFRHYNESEYTGLEKNIEEDKEAISDIGIEKRTALMLKDDAAILKELVNKAVFPVQVGISEWMGDTKIKRFGKHLVSEKQIEEMLPLLQPGDIFLERRNWYISNIGLPGFWPHAALVIGSVKEREKFFNTQEVSAWVKSKGEASGDFEALLKKTYGESYEKMVKQTDGEHPYRIIEAISEGVVFNTVEHSAAADSVCLLRPRLSKLEKAKAIFRAFHYLGRPYDFNFDFLTDSELVCTELVTKSYAPMKDKKGLKIPLVRIVGRQTLPANEIVKIFNKEYGTDDQQFDLVIFLDGNDATGTATKRDVAAFRESCKRPKWHTILQRKESKK